MDTDQSDSDHQSDIEHQPDAASENENSDSDDENGIEEETPEDRVSKLILISMIIYDYYYVFFHS